MSLLIENFLQENSGTNTTSTTHNVTLPSGTEEGSAVWAILVANAAPTGLPSGWGSGPTTGTAPTISNFYGVDNVGAETSWTFTFAATTPLTWYVFECNNLNPDEPIDVVATNPGQTPSNGGSVTSGTTPTNGGLSSAAIAVFASNQGAGETHSFAGYTNTFTEIADVNPGAGTSGYEMAVARRFRDGSTSIFSTTTTFSTNSGTTETVAAAVFVLRANDSPLVAPLVYFTGFEWGTYGGIGNTGDNALLANAFAPTGTAGTNYLIQGSSARGGNYGLQITQSAATAGVGVGTMASKTGAFGLNCRVVSGSGVAIVAWADVAAGGVDVVLVYNFSTNKYGLRWGPSGTPSYQPGTTALNTWVWVEVRYTTATTTHHAEWRIETGANTYTDQTSPTDETGTAGAGISRIVLGSPSISQTLTADYDDVCISEYYTAYPLQPHNVRLLTVDTGGTPTVSGTTTNFNVFTANGTLAAWNATNARNAVDEVPPTVSASADGVVQVTTAASDYMEFPMATYTCSATEVIGGVRLLAPAWGGAGAGTGTLGLRGHDGTAEATLISTATAYDAASPTAVDATTPLWQCAMWPQSAGWTQAKLDAAAVRVGFSSDATPDMGVSAIYLEVATRSANVYRQMTLEDPPATLDLRVNPYSSASVSYLITNNDATRSVTFRYALAGVAQTPVTVGPSSNQTVQVAVTAFGDVSDLSLAAA